MRRGPWLGDEMEEKGDIFRPLKMDEAERLMGLAIEEAEEEADRAFVLSFFAMIPNVIMVIYSKLYLGVDLIVSIGIVLFFVAFLLTAYITLLKIFIYGSMDAKEAVEFKKNDSKSGAAVNIYLILIAIFSDLSGQIKKQILIQWFLFLFMLGIYLLFIGTIKILPDDFYEHGNPKTYFTAVVSPMIGFFSYAFSCCIERYLILTKYKKLLRKEDFSHAER